MHYSVVTYIKSHYCCLLDLHMHTEYLTMLQKKSLFKLLQFVWFKSFLPIIIYYSTTNSRPAYLGHSNEERKIEARNIDNNNVWQRQT